MNNTNETLQKFKEDMLNKLKEYELKMVDSQLIIRSHVDKKIANFEKQCDEFNMRVTDVQDITISQKEKIEKINELLKYKQTSSDQIFTTDLKLNNLENEFSKACAKYDRHYLDNLVLPGTIGDYCKYKNMKEYLEYNITTVANLVTFKDKHVIELKSYKERLDQMIKTLDFQINTCENNLREYLNKAVSSLEKSVTHNLNEMNVRISEVKMENNKYSYELKKNSDNLLKEIENITKIREDIAKKYEGSIRDLKDLNKNTNENFEELRGEFNLLHTKFADLSDFIKDVRFRKNLGGGEVKKSDFKKMAKRLGQKGDYDKYQGLETAIPAFLQDPQHYYSEDKPAYNQANVVVTTGNNQHLSHANENTSHPNNKAPVVESLIKSYIQGGVSAYNNAYNHHKQRIHSTRKDLAEVEFNNDPHPIEGTPDNTIDRINERDGNEQLAQCQTHQKSGNNLTTTAMIYEAKGKDSNNAITNVTNAEKQGNKQESIANIQAQVIVQGNTHVPNQKSVNLNSYNVKHEGIKHEAVSKTGNTTPIRNINNEGKVELRPDDLSRRKTGNLDVDNERGFDSNRKSFDRNIIQGQQQIQANSLNRLVSGDEDDENDDDLDEESDYDYEGYPAENLGVDGEESQVNRGDGPIPLKGKGSKDSKEDENLTLNSQQSNSKPGNSNNANQVQGKTNNSYRQKAKTNISKANESSTKPKNIDYIKNNNVNKPINLTYQKKTTIRKDSQGREREAEPERNYIESRGKIVENINLIPQKQFYPLPEGSNNEAKGYSSQNVVQGQGKNESGSLKRVVKAKGSMLSDSNIQQYAPNQYSNESKGSNDNRTSYKDFDKQPPISSKTINKSMEKTQIKKADSLIPNKPDSNKGEKRERVDQDIVRVVDEQMYQRFNEFNDNFNYFKQGMFKKIYETENKFSEIENKTAKKIEELIQQIRNYLPINVNVNTSSQMINSMPGNNNSGGGYHQNYATNVLPSNTQILSSNLPINSANINIVSGGSTGNYSLSQQSVNLPIPQYNIVSSNSTSNLNSMAGLNNSAYGNIGMMGNTSSNKNLREMKEYAYEPQLSVPNQNKFSTTNNLPNSSLMFNNNQTSYQGQSFQLEQFKAEMFKERDHSLKKKTTLMNIENDLNTPLPQVYLHDTRNNPNYQRLNNSKEFKSSKVLMKANDTFLKNLTKNYPSQQDPIVLKQINKSDGKKNFLKSNTFTNRSDRMDQEIDNSRNNLIQVIADEEVQLPKKAGIITLPDPNTQFIKIDKNIKKALI